MIDVVLNQVSLSKNIKKTDDECGSHGGTSKELGRHLPVKKLSRVVFHRPTLIIFYKHQNTPDHLQIDDLRGYKY